MYLYMIITESKYPFLDVITQIVKRCDLIERYFLATISNEPWFDQNALNYDTKELVSTIKKNYVKNKFAIYLLYYHHRTYCVDGNEPMSLADIEKLRKAVSSPFVSFHSQEPEIYESCVDPSTCPNKNKCQDLSKYKDKYNTSNTSRVWPMKSNFLNINDNNGIRKIMKMANVDFPVYIIGEYCYNNNYAIKLLYNIVSDEYMRKKVESEQLIISILKNHMV